MKLLEILQRMFVERYCVLCEEPIPYDDSEPFCCDCREQWDAFLKVKCRKCGRDHNMCTCLPAKVKKINHGIAAWCVFYDASTNGDINKLFFTLKRRYDREIIDLCAQRMIKALLAISKSRGINLGEYVVTYAPRRDRSVNVYGFDQSRKLAKAIGKKLGVDVITTFENVGNKEQKGLNKTERLKNAQANYEFIEGSLKGNKKVILVDDIMTSGATFFACSFQLFKNGATDVIPVAFAKDNYKAKGDKRNVKRNSKYNFTRAIKNLV